MESISAKVALKQLIENRGIDILRNHYPQLKHLKILHKKMINLYA